MSKGKKIYVVAGPTAVGKTAVAIALARKLGAAIVSADSRQCYREMNIGVARPSPQELQAVQHYFIGEFSITTILSAADYEALALQYLNKIFATQDTAVICGGTGLYIKALCEGLDEMPDTDPAIVAAIEQQYATEGIAWLQAAVAAEDPEFYKAGEIHNPARMLRALAFVRSAGASILRYRTRIRKERPFDIVKVGIELPREALYAHINSRVDAMVQAGLIEEATALYALRHLKSLQTVGYQEIFDLIDGKYSRGEAIDKIKQHTRNYAKRQLTWFRRDAEMHWLRADADHITESILAIKES